ncbi:Hypothetical protein BSSP2_I0353 [Brucella suis bv. 2]|uniref:Uncharacterized protein n=1 Tax=Brucella abortus (strain S19) TaxID=430066 RepID=A0A0F6AP72_BRUA1|nr:hypothetical protein BAbS19_I03320 [Brucella abortus S19]AIB17085.1 Hypothetical protein BSSP3_I0353 [Brucella suis bv. 2]AIB20463.1 Hypothetical protein BSPT1_I0357 [Brucella suis bv. 2]AIB27221.1 Hypothetical protein BSSP1_I0352 [Brucella suis bv. 2]AIB30585.1 Hypothetical protein BSSP2_I0353 [Brucella suis bv. 2]
MTKTQIRHGIIGKISRKLSRTSLAFSGCATYIDFQRNLKTLPAFPPFA